MLISHFFRVESLEDDDTNSESKELRLSYLPKDAYHVPDHDKHLIHLVLHGWLDVHPPSRFQYWFDDVSAVQIYALESKVRIQNHPI